MKKIALVFILLLPLACRTRSLPQNPEFQTKGVADAMKSFLYQVMGTCAENNIRFQTVKLDFSQKNPQNSEFERIVIRLFLKIDGSATIDTTNLTLISCPDPRSCHYETRSQEVRASKWFFRDGLLNIEKFGVATILNHGGKSALGVTLNDYLDETGRPRVAIGRVVSSTIGENRLKPSDYCKL